MEQEARGMLSTHVQPTCSEFFFFFFFLISRAIYVVVDKVSIYSLTH